MMTAEIIEEEEMTAFAFSTVMLSLPECPSGTLAGGEDPYKVTALMLTEWTSAGTGSERELAGQTTSSISFLLRKTLYW